MDNFSSCRSPSPKLPTIETPQFNGTIQTKQTPQTNLSHPQDSLSEICSNTPMFTQVSQESKRIRLLARNHILISQLKYSSRQNKREIEKSSRDHLTSSNNQSSSSSSSSIQPLQSVLTSNTGCRQQNLIDNPKAQSVNINESNKPTNQNQVSPIRTSNSNPSEKFLSQPTHPIHTRPSPIANLKRLRLKEKVKERLPYLKRNWLKMEHHRATQVRDKMCRYHIEFQLDLQLSSCRSESLDIQKLEIELSPLRFNYQLFLLPGGSQSQSSDLLLEDYLWRQLKFWNPIDQHLSNQWVTKISFLPILKISSLEKHLVLKLAVYHRQCLQYRLIKFIQTVKLKALEDVQEIRGNLNGFDPNSASIQRMELQRKQLNLMFGNLPKLSSKSMKVQKKICSSVRNHSRQVKVPSRIGALHFQTMEPYREGDLVYDSEDETPPERYDWRRYRSAQACERASQLSIIERCNILTEESLRMNKVKGGRYDKKSSNWLAVHKLRTFWNQYLHAVTGISSLSSSIILDYLDLQNFITTFVNKFHSNSTSRIELVKFLLSFNYAYRDSNFFKIADHTTSSSIPNPPHLLSISSLLQYYDFLVYEKHHLENRHKSNHLNLPTVILNSNLD